MTKAEQRREGVLAERADVLAWMDKIGGANARLAERGDAASHLMEHRIMALREAIASGVHEGEGANG